MFSSKRGRKSNEIACIFVHAGAGFHSIQNENVHLQACNDAARTGMQIMKNGGSAVDAVELAVRVLEDREITNAGYGSNLAVDGVVECDALVVDHFARSGAAGAVAQIKNPISLARLLLDHTTQTLSLRRVPPNLLVGQGATDFAYEHGMPVLPPDCLVSPAALERWRKWRDDLDRAERNRRRENTEHCGASLPPSQSDLIRYYSQQSKMEQGRMAHANAMKTGVWNEAQPISPPPPDELETHDDSSLQSHAQSSGSMQTSESGSNITHDSREAYIDPYGPPGSFENACANPLANSAQRNPTPPTSEIRSSHEGGVGGLAYQQRCQWKFDRSDSDGLDMVQLMEHRHMRQGIVSKDGSSGSDSEATTVAHKYQRTSSPLRSDGGPMEDTLTPRQHDSRGEQTVDPRMLSSALPSAYAHSSPDLLPPLRLRGNDVSQDEDIVTDTVGAIAIDLYGNIACAASSGGIGIKHRGRVGPAALVGIGAAVIPADADDPEHVTVGTVTSGTGEHMATTNAASVCSERVYQSVQKAAGSRLEPCTEDEALKQFIEKDFMKHPSVQQSHSTGAIGVLSVKKTKDGSFLFYAHNTDSFALASMHSDETRPVCTMSRSKGNGVIAQGGRSIRHRKRKNLAS